MRGITKEWITFIFISVIIGVIKFTFHELWKDEWQSWLVARDQNLFQTLSFLNYEGHPSLWYLFLKPFTYLSDFIKEDVLIKASHYPLVIASLYVLFIKYKIPYLLKVMSSFSYFLFFEYGVVCRGYILVILLSFLAILFIKEKKKIGFAVTLFFLCQTEVYGVIIGLSLLLYQFHISDGLKAISREAFAYLFGVLVFILSVYPRGNEDDFSRAYNKEKLSTTVISKSIQGNISNNFAIGIIRDTAAHGSSALGLILAILILGATIYIFKNRKDVLISWVTLVLSFILFGILIYSGGVRQWGILFIGFICLLELYGKDIEQKAKLLVTSILLIAPIIHNLRAIKDEIILPFSNAQNAGSFIKAKIPSKVPIVSLNKFETANVAAYAERKFYELPSGTEFTYFKWLEKIYLPTQTELILFTKYKGTKGIVVVSSKPIDKQRFPFLKLWETFENANIKRENYYLYVLNLEQLGSN